MRLLLGFLVAWALGASLAVAQGVTTRSSEIVRLHPTMPECGMGQLFSNGSDHWMKIPVILDPGQTVILFRP